MAAKFAAKQAINHEEDLVDFLDSFDEDLCKVSVKLSYLKANTPNKICPLHILIYIVSSSICINAERHRIDCFDSGDMGTLDRKTAERNHPKKLYNRTCEVKPLMELFET